MLHWKDQPSNLTQPSLKSTTQSFRSQPIATTSAIHSDLRKRPGKIRKKRKPYHSINSNVRRVLLYMVKDRNFSIKEAAIKLNMNYSTAKTILQLFRRTGRIDKIDKQDLINTASQFGIDQQTLGFGIAPQQQQCYCGGQISCNQHSFQPAISQHPSNMFANLSTIYSSEQQPILQGNGICFEKMDQISSDLDLSDALEESMATRDLQRTGVQENSFKNQDSINTQALNIAKQDSNSSNGNFGKLGAQDNSLFSPFTSFKSMSLGSPVLCNQTAQPLLQIVGNINSNSGFQTIIQRPSNFIQSPSFTSNINAQLLSTPFIHQKSMVGDNLSTRRPTTILTNNLSQAVQNLPLTLGAYKLNNIKPLQSSITQPSQVKTLAAGFKINIRNQPRVFTEDELSTLRGFFDFKSYEHLIQANNA
eukprot:403351507